MRNDAFIILIINALAYITLFVAYELRKRVFDIGSILLLVWVLGSLGSVYYYTFAVSYLSYDNITILPLVFLFGINYMLFSPFLKTNYTKLKKIEIYNLKGILDFCSLFFGIVGILPLVDVILKLSSFSLVGSALAEMYSSDEDKANLIFTPSIKPFYSVLRHFTVFIVFLFFYQLSQKKVSFVRLIGLGGNLMTFLLVAVLSGSRGGIVSLLVICAYFLFFVKKMMQPRIYRAVMRIGYMVCVIVVLGIASISVSRLSDVEDKKGKDLLMDQWISQYVGEGIIRYDSNIWHLENHLNGAQNIPYLYSFVDSSIKDLDTYANKAENKIKTPVTVFYTYVGDLMMDFGIVGTMIVAFVLYCLIRYLIQIKKARISIYHLILLAFIFEYLTVGFTANIFRTYYTQLQIVKIVILLGGMYLFQKLHQKTYGTSCSGHISL